MENNTRIVAEHKLTNTYAVMVFTYDDIGRIIACEVGTQASRTDPFILHQAHTPHLAFGAWDFAKVLSIFLDFIKDNNPSRLCIQATLLNFIDTIKTYTEASLKRKIINSLS